MIYKNNKNIFIAFYISYYYSNFSYNNDIILYFLNYFRYFNFNNINYNSIKLEYLFNNYNNNYYNNNINIANNNTILDSLYNYDNKQIYYNRYSNTPYYYNLILSNINILKKLIINIKFYYNNIEVFNIKKNYNDLFYNEKHFINKNNLNNKNIEIIFHEEYNYFNMNYINDKNITIQNNLYINNNFSKKFIFRLKYLIIPNIIKLF